MRVLYLPLGDQPGTEKAFRNIGMDLTSFNFWDYYQSNPNNNALNQKFLEYVDSCKPQWIHMQLQMTGLLSTEILNRARQISPGVIISNWSGDVRKNPSMDFISISHACDYSLISNRGQLEVHSRTGCKNVRYLQTGYDPEMFYPTNQTDFKYDVVFLANMYPNTLFPDATLRYQIASKLRETFGHRAGLFGTGYPSQWNIQHTQVKDINDIYNSSRCVLSVSNFNDIEHYFSDRLLIAMGSGRPALCWSFPGYQSYFAHGSDLIIVRNISEMVDQINLLKENSEYANEVGIKGGMKVKAEHTFTSRIMELAKIVGVL